MVIETRIINEDTKSTITEDVVCSECHHDCHCDGDLHADEYGVCTCEDCRCSTKKRVESIQRSVKDSNEWIQGHKKWLADSEKA